MAADIDFDHDEQRASQTMGDSKLEDIQAALRTLTVKMDKVLGMEDKLQDLQKSVTYVSNSFDEFNKQLQILTGENKDLKEQLTKTTIELNDLQQYTRRNNLEISGIPQQDNENTDDIVVKVAAAAGVRISSDDIDISHRLPRRTRRNSQDQHQPAPIIVKFVRRTIRNKIYSSKKLLKDKTARHIGAATNYRIFINENLTPTNKQLFYQTNQLRTAKQWKFIWTNNGKIYTRKTTDDPAIHIATSKDLCRIV
ncbi:uncharacterized protein [Ptychodera flava]|uniref:uncharacterized protein n=1 Tax=Ptychodera flava TaxID=63121 RepID=UPI00396A5A05